LPQTERDKDEKIGNAGSRSRGEFPMGKSKENEGREKKNTILREVPRGGKMDGNRWQEIFQQTYAKKQGLWVFTFIRGKGAEGGPGNEEKTRTFERREQTKGNRGKYCHQ